MTLIVSTLEGPLGHAARLDIAEVNKLHPAVVDEWLINPVMDCLCPHQARLVVVSLAGFPGAAPVEGVLAKYSHQVRVHTLAERPDGPWTPEQLATEHVFGAQMLNHPLILDSDIQARILACSLVDDIVAGALPAFLISQTEVAQWRLAINLALWRHVHGTHLSGPDDV